jgi:hypothetical protein
VDNEMRNPKIDKVQNDGDEDLSSVDVDDGMVE